MGSEFWTRENLAWVAGIIEGEGYIAARPIKYKNGTSFALQVQIEMSDEDVLLLLQKRAGMGNVTGPFRRDSPKHMKPTWHYGVYGAEAYALLIAILPWLCERRRQAALTGIRVWLTLPGRGMASRKLTDDQVRQVRHAVNVEGRTIRAVADEFNSNHHSIMQIAKGVYYKNVSQHSS